MRHAVLLAAPMLLTAAADAPAILPGQWTVTSKASELVIPGVPGFLLSLAKKKTRTENKCVTPEQAAGGIARLLEPKDAKTCTVTRRDVAAGQVTQAMTCRGKDGTPINVTMTGSYDQASFTGRVEMTGTTKKGPMRVVASQSARRVAATCKS